MPAPWKKSYDQPRQHIKKQRHSFANKGLVEAMVFPVVMYGCESRTIKKAESQRIDAFELWCWRRLLRVPWTARRSNQSIVKEISPEYSWEGLMLKLKLQYFGHLMRRTYSLGKTLMLEKTEGGRRRGWQRMRWLDDGHEFEQVLGVGDGQGSLACCSPWGWRVGHDWVTELNWTDMAWCTHSINLLLHIQCACCPKYNFNFRYLKGITSCDILLLMCIITNYLHQG